MDLQVVETALNELGIAVGGPQLRQMGVYLECVLASQTANVTAIKDPDVAIRLHILDSLLALPAVDRAPAGPLVDVGTGGGFPGVPLALASGRHTVLLDSVGKKLSLIEECLRSSGTAADIETVHARSEEYATRVGASAAVVVARAVAETPALLELCRPLAKRGGIVVLLKGPAGPEEAERAATVAELLGFGAPLIDEYVLPGGEEQRLVYTFPVAAESGVRLPRRPGMATKKPLA